MKSWRRAQKQLSVFVQEQKPCWVRTKFTKMPVVSAPVTSSPSLDIVVSKIVKKMVNQIKGTLEENGMGLLVVYRFSLTTGTKI